MVRYKSTGPLVLLMALLLAFCLGPVRAYADTTPAEFYQDLAATVGVAIDLGSEAWENKTTSAYLSYISENMRNSNAQSFYETGAAIEQLTGYNVVSVRDGRYYMNSCDDGSGGAMYDIDCGDVSNMAALSKETMKWIRYAANNGPDWPNGGSSSGGGSGGGSQIATSVTLTTVYAGSWAEVRGTYGCMGYVGTSNSSENYVSWGVKGTPLAPSSVTVSFSQSQVDTINSAAEESGLTPFVFLGNSYGTAGPATYNRYTIKIMLIDASGLTLGDNSSYTTFGHYYTGSYIQSYITNLQIVNGNVDVSSKSINLGSLSQATNMGMKANYACYAYSGSFGGGGGGGAIEGDDTPPSPPTIPRPDISWPDITLPSLPDFNPTINITTGGSYDQSTGVIDFTPITDRLDAINQNLEFFYESFNNYRADFLSYMDTLGDNLNDISVRLWELEAKCREAITWLRNIFYRLGGTGGSQPDISTNGPGFWDWLRDILTELLGGMPSTLGQMIDVFEDLSGYFPFSVPWDVYALLAMFDAPRQSPVFDLPMPVPSLIDNNKYLTLHIDFSPYDGVAAEARKIELIGFCTWLALNTTKLLGATERLGRKG